MAVLLLTCPGTIITALLIDWYIVRETLSKLQIGMPKAQVRSLVGMPISEDLQTWDTFPVLLKDRMIVLLGEPNAIEHVDSYSWGLGYFWVCYDADEQLTAVMEEVDD